MNNGLTSDKVHGNKVQYWEQLTCREVGGFFLNKIQTFYKMLGEKIIYVSTMEGYDNCDYIPDCR